MQSGFSHCSTGGRTAKKASRSSARQGFQEGLARDAQRVPDPHGAFRSQLEVDVEGDESIITKPGPEFLVGYKKRPDEPFLVMTRTCLGPEIPPRRG